MAGNRLLSFIFNSVTVLRAQKGSCSELSSFLSLLLPSLCVGDRQVLIWEDEFSPPEQTWCCPRPAPDLSVHSRGHIRDPRSWPAIHTLSVFLFLDAFELHLGHFYLLPLSSYSRNWKHFHQPGDVHSPETGGGLTVSGESPAVTPGSPGSH